MEVNRQKVGAAGTLVLERREAAGIDLDGKLVGVSFVDDGGATRVEPGPSGLRFLNMDATTLGCFISLKTPLDGRAYHMRFAVWSVGAPAGGFVLHYTITG